MVIRDEKEYKDYEARMEKLIERGTELGDMELLSPEEKAEFTQKEAAQMIGISATTFSDLLHGRRSMSFDIARSLYKVLGVPAEVVLA